jgi:hypothetical protein
LPLSFSILERNDGAPLEIIYTVKPDGRASMSATIVGAGQPREAIVAQDRPPDKPKLNTATLALALLVLVPLALAGLAPLRLPPERLTRAATLALSLIAASAAVVGFFSADVYRAWKHESIPATIRAKQQ